MALPFRQKAMVKRKLTDIAWKKQTLQSVLLSRCFPTRAVVFCPRSPCSGGIPGSPSRSWNTLRDRGRIDRDTVGNPLFKYFYSPKF